MKKKEGADARSKVGPLNKSKSKKTEKQNRIIRGEMSKGSSERNLKAPR